jgi:hypothetical protein
MDWKKWRNRKKREYFLLSLVLGVGTLVSAFALGMEAGFFRFLGILLFGAPMALHFYVLSRSGFEDDNTKSEQTGCLAWLLYPLFWGPAVLILEYSN